MKSLSKIVNSEFFNHHVGTITFVLSMALVVSGILVGTFIISLISTYGYLLSPYHLNSVEINDRTYDWFLDSRYSSYRYALYERRTRLLEMTTPESAQVYLENDKWMSYIHKAVRHASLRAAISHAESQVGKGMHIYNSNDAVHTDEVQKFMDAIN